MPEYSILAVIGQVGVKAILKVLPLVTKILLEANTDKSDPASD